MEKRELQIGDLCQINPSHPYGGALIAVTDPKEWGAVGYLMCEYETQGLVRFKGRAFLRIKWEDMEYIGKLEWLNKDDVEPEGEAG